jgi:hypothetical protein
MIARATNLKMSDERAKASGESNKGWRFSVLQPLHMTVD